MTQPSYGTATVIRVEDGTLVVAGKPDDIIGVHASLYDEMMPGHRHDDGTIQLDCAGRHHYRPVGQDPGHPDVLIFERVPADPVFFSHHPQSHGTDIRQPIPKEQL